MIIYITEDCESYGVHCGETIDTSLPDSPITDIQAIALYRKRYATFDLDINETRHIQYIEKEYDCNAVVVKDNAMYQLKPNTTASVPFDPSEWDLILQGS
ncbi:hypothetical protein ACN9J3_06120 [Aliarcobacter butzleri]|uniref:hypothetical protein n=1 Tax=Aliarcobacter butzleri TaxID=28197 RepID=UPI003B20C00D